MFQRNRIELTGNITKPAATTQVGETTVTRARLIHREAIHRRNGEPIEELVAIEIEIWGRRGKAFEFHVGTNTPVYIEGRLQLDQWESDGERRHRISIRVSDWQFLTGRQAVANKVAA